MTDIIEKWVFLVAVLMASTGCSSATYSVKDPTTGKILQSVSADAPGGDTFVTVVYFGANKTPIINAGGDSTALVEATAAAGRRAVDLALKAAKP